MKKPNGSGKELLGQLVSLGAFSLAVVLFVSGLEKEAQKLYGMPYAGHRFSAMPLKEDIHPVWSI